jgi:hypothetical protein
MAKAFANRAFYAVSFDGITLRFNRNSESEMSEVIRDTKDRALAKAQDLRSLKKPAVFPVVMQPKFRAESKIIWRQR